MQNCASAALKDAVQSFKPSQLHHRAVGGALAGGRQEEPAQGTEQGKDNEWARAWNGWWQAEV